MTFTKPFSWENVHVEKVLWNVLSCSQELVNCAAFFALSDGHMTGGKKRPRGNHRAVAAGCRTAQVSPASSRSAPPRPFQTRPLRVVKSPLPPHFPCAAPKDSRQNERLPMDKKTCQEKTTKNAKQSKRIQSMHSRATGDGRETSRATCIRISHSPDANRRCIASSSPQPRAASAGLGWGSQPGWVRPQTPFPNPTGSDSVPQRFACRESGIRTSPRPSARPPLPGPSAPLVRTRVGLAI